MYDCSSLKYQRCIQKYCCCCCPGILNDTGDQKYPHIAYGRLHLQGEEKLESRKGVKSVPYQRIFQYPQPQQQYSIHPQLDKDQFVGVPSVISQQPHSKEYSGEVSESPFLIQELMSKKQPLDYSPYGSMDDIGAEIGFVDMAKSSVYVESDEPEDNPALACRARSISPLLSSIPSVSDVGTELQKRSLHPVCPSSLEAPCVHFSLYYDDKNQKLIVHLKQAFKLPTNRPEESSNPFTDIYLLPKKGNVHKSHIQVKTHNPVFDETFKFTDLDPHVINKQTVVMRVYINERNHFVGGVLYPLESASMNGDLIKAPISEFEEEQSLKVRN